MIPAKTSIYKITLCEAWFHFLSGTKGNIICLETTQKLYMSGYKSVAPLRLDNKLKTKDNKALLHCSIFNPNVLFFGLARHVLIFLFRSLLFCDRKVPSVVFHSSEHLVIIHLTECNEKFSLLCLFFFIILHVFSEILLNLHQ